MTADTTTAAQIGYWTLSAAAVLAAIYYGKSIFFPPRPNGSYVTHGEMQELKEKLKKIESDLKEDGKFVAVMRDRDQQKFIQTVAHLDLGEKKK